MSPNELRVAIAASPQRTTVWTSLDFDSWPTTIGLVVPVPPGTSVDVAPDAWFAALDVALAPRIVDAPNLTCPDGSPLPTDGPCVGNATITGATPSVPAVSFDTLVGPDAVTKWANDHDMAVPDDVAGGLAELTGQTFVAVRFIVPPPGAGVTQTIRFVMPGVPPKLALSLFEPGDRSPFVTTYLIGPSLGTLVGASLAPPVDGTQLWPDDCSAQGYYAQLYDLLGDPGTALVQAAGNAFWTTPASYDEQSGFESVMDAYFAGAAQEGTAPHDTSACVQAADIAFTSNERVAQACPAGAATFVAGPSACDPGRPRPVWIANEVNPTSFACGAADDISIAASGLPASSVWVTRLTQNLASAAGVDYPVVFADGPGVWPIVDASFISTGVCPQEDAGTGASASSSGNSSGCDGGAAADGAAEGCGAAADGLSGLGDLGDCRIGHARPGGWGIIALAALLAPLRRRGRRSRRPS
jgi:hypothetical protein